MVYCEILVSLSEIWFKIIINIVCALSNINFHKAFLISLDHVKAEGSKIILMNIAYCIV